MNLGCKYCTVVMASLTGKSKIIIRQAIKIEFIQHGIPMDLRYIQLGNVVKIGHLKTPCGRGEGVTSALLSNTLPYFELYF